MINRRFSGAPGFYHRLPWWLSGKQSACNAGDLGLIPGSGRSPGGGLGNPLEYSCLEDPMDRGAWWATVHGVTQSKIWLKGLSIACTHIKKILFHYGLTWNIENSFLCYTVGPCSLSIILTNTEAYIC